MLLSLILPQAAAFCGTYVGQAGSDLYNHASQVALVRDGNRTTLSLAMDYEGELASFALVVPVPEVLGPEDVRVLSPDLFTTLDTYSGPRLVSYVCSDFSYYYYGYDEDNGYGSGGGCWGCGATGDKDTGSRMYDGASSDTAGPPPTVIVEASFTEGDYEIVILSAEESAGLYNWLSDNGYALPAGGEAILDEYIAAGSYFFAAKVTLEAAEAGVVGLAPLQFSYDSEVFSLPVRIGTISSAGDQDVIVYGLTTASQGTLAISNYPEVALESECMWEDDGEGFGAFYDEQYTEAQALEDRPGWLTEYAWTSGACDPCSGNPPDKAQLSELGFVGDSWDMQFTRLHIRYGANDVDQDLSLYTTGITSQEQVRYITYNHELEDMYPVCGEGFVADPGTCEDDASKAVKPRGASGVWPVALLAMIGMAVATRRRR